MKYTYIAFNKPFQVVSQFSPLDNKRTLKDFISIPDIYPVGRLDYDSEGLLILTNDNKLKSFLTDPKFDKEKTYLVQVEGIPKENDLDKLRKGILIKDYKTKEAKVRILDNEPNLHERTPPIRFRKNIPDSWLEITIKEGKNRQVRKMTASIGYPTLRLVRVKINNFNLDEIPLGEYKILTKKEVELLYK